MIKMNSIVKAITEFFKYKSLAYELVLRDVKVRYRRSVLGLLWTMLTPVLTMLVLTIIFSQLFQRDIENYVVYLLSGNILFSFFNESTATGMRSILDGSSLINKVYIPKCLFPIARSLSSAVNLFFAIIALLVVMLITGSRFHLSLLMIPVVVSYLFMFATGIGMILSSYVIFFRDITHIYGVVIMLWMYVTPIFYPETLVEEVSPLLLQINPMYHYIHYFRSLILVGEVPGLQENLICFGIGLLTLFIGFIVIIRKQNKFILYI